MAIIFAIFNTSHYWSSLCIKFLPFWFTFGLLNNPPIVIVRYFFLLVFSYFQSFYGLRLKLIPFLLSSEVHKIFERNLNDLLRNGFPGLFAPKIQLSRFFTIKLLFFQVRQYNSIFQQYFPSKIKIPLFQMMQPGFVTYYVYLYYSSNIKNIFFIKT